MRIGIGLSEDLPLVAQQSLARSVEVAGLSSIWTNEARGRDALLLCQAWAAATTELEVGVGVVPLWTRSPAQLAMACATLQEASAGRFVLGLGVGHPATMGPWHGADYRRPRTAAIDTLRVLRQVLLGGTTDHVGSVRSSRHFALEVTPRPEPPRVLLAAMGPRMLATAGAEADGALLNWAAPREVARAAGAVRTAAAGRPVEVATYVRVAVDADRGRARAALAQEVGRYCALPAYADHLDRQGFGTTVDAVKAAYRDGGAAAVPHAIDDDTLFELGWFGTPDDDPSPTLERYRSAGLDHLIARVVVTRGDPDASARAVLQVLGSAGTA